MKSGFRYAVATALFLGLTGDLLAQTAPVASSDAYSIGRTGLLEAGVTRNILDNDRDADGDLLEAVLVSDVGAGTLTLSPDGSFEYDPKTAPSTTLSTSFTYRARSTVDNQESQTVSVRINITDNNIRPRATRDQYVVPEDGTVVRSKANGLLANDFDSDVHDEARAFLVAPPDQGGTLTVNPDGSFTYQPPPNYNGVELAGYQISDGELESDNSSGTPGLQPTPIVFTITSVNDAPVAVDDVRSMPEDGTLNDNVLLNDEDVDGNTLTANLVPGSGPSNGTLSFNADGSFTYIPAPDYNGPDSFAYIANDGSLDSAQATVSITVKAENDPPVATDDTYHITEDNTLSVDVASGVLKNDTDADGQNLEAQTVTTTSNGTLHLNADGSFDYVPDADYTGTDTFTYRAFDGAESAEATVTINVDADNDPPVAQDDSYSISAGGTLRVDAGRGLTANDSDVESGHHLTVIQVAPFPTATGTLNLENSGAFSFTPAVGFSGTASFQYQASDGAALSNVATVTFTVSAVDANRPPIAGRDTYSTPQNTTLQVPAPGLLVNDRDLDGDTVGAINIGQPANGTVQVNRDGSFTYTPNPGFSGSDSFVYIAVDGSKLQSLNTTVTIDVRPGNAPPEARPDSYSGNEDAPLIITAPGPLANDSDPNGDPLAMRIKSPVTNGRLQPFPDGGFVFYPAANFKGSASFTYAAWDGTDESSPVTVSITVNEVNDAPVAQPDSYRTAENTALRIPSPGSLPGLLANDTDPEGDSLTARLVTAPSNGSLSAGRDGSFTYVPNPLYNGLDTFTYLANDGLLNSAPVQVVIAVTPVNSPPRANSDSYTVIGGATLNVPAPGLLDNDVDLDGDALLIAITSQPTNGTLVPRGGGAFTYTPAVGFAGLDSFQYTVNDGRETSAPATVTVAVLSSGVVPLAASDAYSTTQGAVLSETAARGVLANDISPDGTRLTVTGLVTGEPANGLLQMSPDGAFTYRPLPGFSGVDHFTYRASNSSGPSAPVEVQITVNPANQPPEAKADAYTVISGIPLSVSAASGLLANDSDPEGNPVTPQLGTGPSNGTLSIRLDGSFRYTPNPGFTGTDRFDYRVNDGTSNSDLVPVVLTVLPAQGATPPVAGADSYTAQRDTTLSVSAKKGVLANDIESNGGTLFVNDFTQPSNGRLQMALDGGFTYFPNAGYGGLDSFTYEVSNGQDSATATVVIDVRIVNEAPVGNPDAYTVFENTTLDVPVSGGVLANDTDANKDVLTARVVTSTTSGALGLRSDGSFTYLPATNFNGKDSFSYVANDGRLDSAPVTVTIKVRGINAAPLAGPDAYSTTRDALLTKNAANGVLANDIDADGDKLAVTGLVTGEPANGTLQMQTDGAFTYRPAAGFTGVDSFTYQATDGAASSTTVTAQITVLAVNQPPVAQADDYTVLEDTPLSVTAASGLLANDSDPDGNPIVPLLVSGPSQGTLSLSLDGGFVYTPAAGFTGTDTFGYQASDGTATSAVVPVVLTVLAGATATPPIAGADSYSTLRDTTLAVNAANGVLANDIETNGGSLVATAYSQPSHGTLQGNLDGSFTYIPDAGYEGLDSFTYEASNGQDSSEATVVVDVRFVNDPPVAGSPSFDVDEGTTFSSAAPGVLTGASDPDGDQLTARLATGPANGWAQVNLDGSFTYTPNPGFSGADSFTVEISDGVASVQATVSLNVVAAPVVLPVAVPVPTLSGWAALLLLLSVGLLAFRALARGGA